MSTSFFRSSVGSSPFLAVVSYLVNIKEKYIHEMEVRLRLDLQVWTFHLEDNS